MHRAVVGLLSAGLGLCLSLGLATRIAAADTPSEQVRAAIKAGDLVSARAQANAELAGLLPDTPDALAVALDDLGQVDEAAHMPEAARVAYSQALELADTPAVRARWTKLGGALLAFQALVGPKAEPEQLCAGCTVLDSKTPDSGAPFVEVAYLIGGGGGGDDEMVARLSVALHLADGWYLLDHVGDIIPGHAGGHDVDEPRVIGGRLLLVWHASFGRYSHSDETKAVVCGLGAAHKPSCYGPVRIVRSDFEDHVGKDSDFKGKVAYENTIHYDCDVSLHGDDLIVSNLAKPRPVDKQDGLQTYPAPAHACEALPSFGTHHLAF